MRTILVANHHLIRNARMRAGLSIAEAAAKAGISHGSWLRIEQGKRQRQGPQMETLRKISAALGCEITDLYAEIPVDEGAA